MRFQIKESKCPYLRIKTVHEKARIDSVSTENPTQLFGVKGMLTPVQSYKLPINF